MRLHFAFDLHAEAVEWRRDLDASLVGIDTPWGWSPHRSDKALRAGTGHRGPPAFAGPGKALTLLVGAHSLLRADTISFTV